MNGRHGTVDSRWWDASCRRQGHTGWSDRQVYAYDQPVRRDSVMRAIEAVVRRPLSNLDVVDIGCGTGDFALMLADRGAHVLALDFSPAVIEVASERASSRGIPVRFACASATQIPAADASVDLVTSITVLQHLVRDEDLELAMIELARVLRPNGRVIFLELAPPIDSPNRSPEGHVIERPAGAWLAKFDSVGLVVEREFAYPQFGITGLRMLAQGIDRLRQPSATAPKEAPGTGGDSSPAGIGRRLLRGSLTVLRSGTLLATWPLDRLLRLQVPRSQRYYRLWVLKKKDCSGD